jgi:Flp pilus assembly protein TadG
MSARVTRGERGGAALEFALVLPVLLTVVFAALEYGWLFTARMMLANAVSEGARAGSQAREWEGEDPAAFARSAVTASFALFDLPEAAVEVEIRPADAALPRRIAVTVSGLPYAPLVGYLPDAVLPATLAAQSVAVLP